MKFYGGFPQKLQTASAGPRRTTLDSAVCLPSWVVAVGLAAVAACLNRCRSLSGRLCEQRRDDNDDNDVKHIEHAGKQHRRCFFSNKRALFILYDATEGRPSSLLGADHYHDYCHDHDNDHDSRRGEERERYKPEW